MPEPATETTATTAFFPVPGDVVGYQGELAIVERLTHGPDDTVATVSTRTVARIDVPVEQLHAHAA